MASASPATAQAPLHLPTETRSSISPEARDCAVVEFLELYEAQLPYKNVFKREKKEIFKHSKMYIYYHQ